MDSKIQKILQACKRGMAKNKIDPKCNGTSVRALERGQKVTRIKIDQMYANILAYEGQIPPTITFKLKLDPDAKLTIEQKRELLNEAVASGVSPSRIEQNSHGIMQRLLTGKSMRDKSINRLYDNLLGFFGYNIRLETVNNQIKSAPERIRALEIHTLSCIQQIKDLKTEVAHLKKLLQKSSQASSSVPKRPRKILGLTVTRRSSKSNGKTYKRWYAIAKKDGKRKMIYIGKTLAKAEQKIRQGLLRLGIEQ